MCRVGSDADGPGREHWTAMLANPRKPIEHWHQLMEVGSVTAWDVCVLACVLLCVGSALYACHILIKMDLTFIFAPDASLSLLVCLVMVIEERKRD